MRGRIIKTVVFAALLIGVSVYFGFVCGWIEGITLSLSWDLLWLLLWLLLSIGLIAIMAGLVATLIRPLWAAILVFLASAIAVFLSWEISIFSGIAALVYFALSSLYAWRVQRELDGRIKFSVGPISQGQSILLLALIAVACTGLYLGVDREVKAEGISVPPQIMDMVIGIAEDQLPPDLTPEERAAVLAQLRAEFETQVEGFIEPYEGYVPIGIAIGVFAFLYTIIQFLSWIPTLFLRGLFPILTRTGAIKRIPETVEVERLRL